VDGHLIPNKVAKLTLLTQLQFSSGKPTKNIALTFGYYIAKQLPKFGLLTN
jgi:hypothetical protein